MKRVVWCAGILTIVILLLISCKNKEINPLLESGAAVKIGYYSEKEYVERYGDKLEQAYPALTYSIIPTVDLVSGKQDARAWAKENQVDLIYVSSPFIQEFINSDLILSLDALIKMHKFDLEAYYPEVISYVKSLGKGSIFAIPPTMHGSVIAYNKVMFELYQVDAPQHKMTWEQLLELAGEFPEKGLAVPWPSADQLAWKIGAGGGLSSDKKEKQNISVATEEWERAWLAAAKTVNSRSVRYGVSPLGSFLAGESAMTLLSSEDYLRLKKNAPSFEYGLVTMPVQHNAAEYSSDTVADGFYAIASTTKSTEAAFELLTLFLSPSMNEWKEETGVPALRQAEPDEYAETMYMLEPVPQVPLPASFLELGSASFDEILRNPAGVSEILKALEQQLNDTLQK